MEESEKTANKVSIIVPVYQSAKYLPACGESLLRQDYAPLEIIFVDDGSRDGSGELCDAYAARDGRVRVIHQENAGLSAARNRGLDAATGDFILFVDGDDRLLPGAVTAAVMAQARTDADAVLFLHEDVSDTAWKSDPCAPPVPEEIAVYRGAEALFSLLYRLGSAAATAWSKLYRRSIFDDLRFRDVQHEDEEFVSRFFATGPSVAFLPCVLYRYLKRPGSISGEFRPGSADIFGIYRERIELLSRLGLEDLKNETYARFFFAIVDLYAKNKKYGAPLPDSYFRDAYQSIRKELRGVKQVNARFDLLARLMRVHFGFIRLYFLKMKHRI